MIGIAALVIGIVLGLVFHPSVPEVVQPYLPIAVVAALDAVFGGLRAYLERIFDSKVFVVSFVFNVLVAALIVYVGDQLGRRHPAVDRDHRGARHPDLRQRRRPAAQTVRRLTHEPSDPPTPPPEPHEPDQHGRHELPPDEPAPEIGDLHAGWRQGRGAPGPVAAGVRRAGRAAVPAARRRDRHPGPADRIRRLTGDGAARRSAGAAGFAAAAGGGAEHRSGRPAAQRWRSCRRRAAATRPRSRTRRPGWPRCRS